MSATETNETGRDAHVEGTAAAALLAAGCGALVLGIFTTLNEASSSVNDFLRFDDDVGPLSGKTILAAIAYFGSLLVFWLFLRGRQLRLSTVVVVTAILLALGLIGTFPTFFEAFAD